MRTLLLGFALCLVTLVGACPSDSAHDVPDAATLPDGALPETWPECDPAAATQTVTFVHGADLHATYTPDASGESPVSRLRGLYEWTRWQNPYTVFTDGGDAYEKGSVAELLSEGAATREIVWALGYDVRVIGNHDFAWSLEEVLAYSHDPRAAVLASNTTYLGADATAFGAVDYTERQLGCVRIGFFGMVSKPWNELNEQFDGPYYPELDTRYDYVDRAADIVGAHGGDVDLMVMVSHLGLATDQNVAAAVDGIDVVLGGHSHDALDEPAEIGDTLVVHAGAYGSYVGLLDVEVDADTGERLDFQFELVPNDPSTLPVAGGMQQVVQDVLATYAPDALVELAWLAGDLYDSQIAQLTARAAMRSLDVDAVLVDRDTVWQGWESGPLTQQDLADTYKVERQPAGTPGFNSFYTVDILGADLQAIVDALPLTFAYLGPTPIDDAATYTLALQKHAAYNPEAYFVAGVAVSTPVPLMEAWALLDAYARDRTAECLYLDEDTPLPDCL